MMKMNKNNNKHTEYDGCRKIELITVNLTYKHASSLKDHQLHLIALNFKANININASNTREKVCLDNIIYNFKYIHYQLTLCSDINLVMTIIV